MAVYPRVLWQLYPRVYLKLWAVVRQLVLISLWNYILISLWNYILSSIVPRLVSKITLGRQIVVYNNYYSYIELSWASIKFILVIQSKSACNTYDENSPDIAVVSCQEVIRKSTHATPIYWSCMRIYRLYTRRYSNKKCSTHEERPWITSVMQY